LLLLGATGLLLPRDAVAAALAGARLRREGHQTWLELALEGTPAWQLSAQARPPALLLDLPRHAWRGPAMLPGAGCVTALRFAATRRGTRLTIALTGPIAAPRVTERDKALVLELRPGGGPAFARMAAARTLASSSHAQRPIASLPLVVLDPGHGGKDPGAIGAHGTHEKRITLAVALELKRQLEASGQCRVALTRSRDVFIPLADRVEFARRRHAALFLSLHADSAPAESARAARGASVYTLSETASDSLAAALARRENLADRAGGLRLPSVPPEVLSILFSLMRRETRVGSEHLAGLVVQSLDGEVALLPNTHRRAGFVVLKAPDVPAALVELGFLSHPQDEAALGKPAHRAKLAAALSEAVRAFLAHQPQLAMGAE
jgi:N-acetylmuramoyl-L-alanine amidase